MKAKADPRHQRRQKTIQELYEWWFFQDQSARQDKVKKRIKSKITLETLKHQLTIDSYIGEAAQEWPLEGIAKVDLSILRLAVYELCFGHTAPVKVIIDEAVELAKELGGQSSPGFINGVLGKIVNTHEDKLA